MTLTLFQWIALSILSLLLVYEAVSLWRRPVARRAGLVRFLVWALAAVGIADPLLVSWVAQAIGIGRGADVVLYLFVLTFLAAAFYFYSRCVQLERQVTQLVRHLAIQEARQGQPGGGGTTD
jgi:hypothetical protein